MAIIKNPLTIVQTGGESQVPEYMSAKNFTFDGNACTGYVGDNSLPEIIIPQSYSTVSTVETVVGAKVLDKYGIRHIISDFQSATFSDGENNTHIYSSPMELDMLENDFPNDCYLVSMEVSDVYNFIFLGEAYNMQILQFPININGQGFSDGNLAFDYISQNNITNVNFAGDVEVITGYIDGNDYKVTQVSCIEATVSGFKNYKNRVILLSNITTIGGWAFQGCINLTSIEIPNSVTNMGVQVFMGCSNLTNVVLPKGITEITINEFRYCRSLTSINIPSSVTIINVAAFSGCTSLTSVTIPENVTSIGNQAFRNCTSLTTITIPKTVKTIGSSFLDCDALETVTFAEGSQLVSIGKYAFSGCSSLTSIIIPESVTSIGNYAFNNCSSLTTVTILATTPPKLDNINAISTATTKIYIPAGTLSAYQRATNWSNFADLFEELPA